MLKIFFIGALFLPFAVLSIIFFRVYTTESQTVEDYKNKTLDDHLDDLPNEDQDESGGFEEPDEDLTTLPEPGFPEEFPHKQILKNRDITYPHALAMYKEENLETIDQIGQSRSQNIYTWVEENVEFEDQAQIRYEENITTS